MSSMYCMICLTDNGNYVDNRFQCNGHIGAVMCQECNFELTDNTDLPIYKAQEKNNWLKYYWRCCWNCAIIENIMCPLYSNYANMSKVVKNQQQNILSSIHAPIALSPYLCDDLVNVVVEYIAN